MLQIQKRQNYNLKLFKTILTKSLVVIFTTGLFAVNGLGKDLSSEKNKSLLLKPVNGLSDEEYDKFILGKSFFRIPWVEAPSATTARDGLGPLFNANTCASCHPSNGRGTLYNSNGDFSRSLIPKVSLENKKKDKTILETKGLIPEPIYGAQIALNANHGVKFEAKTDITYKEKKITFPDGEIDIILEPNYALKELQYGPLHKDSVLTFRIAPTLNGLGLLSDISNEDILKNEDEFDRDNDGISGRANYVYSPITKKIELGKYSWKATTTSIIHQTADAANNDMGLTTTYYPNENCTKQQEACNNAPKARDALDITDMRLEAMAFYLKKRKTYTANKNTQTYKEGIEIFKQIGCNKCHIESFVTKSGIKIAPFTNMLLHDMGEGLADGRSEFKATGREWRTPPLWGLALHKRINGKNPRLLHDGRARDFQEAILWHGGEAQNVKETFMSLEKEKREKLLKFLEEV
ncbi:di-heme oxidoredictase family protein [Halarcobacter sp.]|uniref:di-heme oxidoredictase family protein n=1 Tax=Halarcobacter sp. TaxID=2321133 RepID=UPI0029F49F2F|nr:di-heme oxidoredictase family protein [Halarcobacter sp.]